MPPDDLRHIHVQATDSGMTQVYGQPHTRFASRSVQACWSGRYEDSLMCLGIFNATTQIIYRNHL